jgi:carbon monoxide dehydrogenase subunit G
MAIFEGSVVLHATPDRAFAIIGDPENGPKIDPMITRYEPEGGVMHEGGRNHIRMRAFGIPIRVVSITREWQPPRLMVLENVKPTRPVRMTLTQTFEPHPEGTLLTYRAEINGFAPAAALFRWLVARNFQRALPRVLDVIRAQASGQ